MQSIFCLIGIFDFIGGLTIPFVFIMIVLAFLLVMKFIASRYKKIPPGRVGIFYGRKYSQTITTEGGEKQTITLGFQVVSGGGRVLMPFVESYESMSTEIFQVDIDEKGIPNMDNVKINAKGVATCKISTKLEELINAAQSFLGKQNEIAPSVEKILKGHLRSIIGKMDIDGLLRKRDEFNKQVVDESTNELKRLGIEIVTLVIQDINDEYGYIDALGKKTVAEAKKEAEIKVAEATRDQDIAVSNAQQKAATVKAENEALIAEAQKNRDIQIAKFKVETETEKAKADKALAIQAAEQDKILKVKVAEAEHAEKEAQVKVQEEEAKRKEQELQATVIKVAKAEKEKKVLEAEAEGEAEQKKAEGRQKALEAEGKGEASKKQAILEAEAKGDAAKKKEALVAEAEGTEKLAKALAEMTADAKLMLILDRLPVLIDKGGDALQKVVEAAFKSVAAPLGNIDSLHIVDIGGNGQGVKKLSTLVPETVLSFFTAMKAAGFDFMPIIRKLGVNTEEFEKFIGALGASSKTGEETTEKKATVEA